MSSYSPMVPLFGRFGRPIWLACHNVYPGDSVPTEVGPKTGQRNTDNENAKNGFSFVHRRPFSLRGLNPLYRRYLHSKKHTIALLTGGGWE